RDEDRQQVVGGGEAGAAVREERDDEQHHHDHDVADQEVADQAAPAARILIRDDVCGGGAHAFGSSVSEAVEASRPDASRKMVSCTSGTASCARESSPATLNSRMTRARCASERISGISLDAITTAMPSAASSTMMR